MIKNLYCTHKTAPYFSKPVIIENSTTGVPSDIPGFDDFWTYITGVQLSRTNNKNEVYNLEYLKKDLFDQIKGLKKYEKLEYKNFNPCIERFPISRIMKNGSVLYSMKVNENENNEANASRKITLKNKDQFSSRVSTLPRLLNTQKQVIHGLRNIKYDELLFDNKKLGSGAQGEVCSGKWIGQPVAIKKIRVMKHNVSMIEREIDVLKLVHHPNIVQTLGFRYHQRIIYIVMDKDIH
ncbi:hypothetical protein HCN44_007187 [Aphidius gifuensis]|uniref:Protein kinase domain-containing protein n=1 Tax=Aphidius gifuensis TaxID=684658 RepID=A0A835CM37_APHGI|nr:hypothetical protein HCN44_007187 [Aphidius gifuensis]